MGLPVTLALLVYISLCVSQAGGLEGPASASKLTHEILERPQLDPYASLGDRELSKEWSQDSLKNSPSLLREAFGRGLQEHKVVTVVLVGFDGSVDGHLKTTVTNFAGLLGKQKASQLHTFAGTKIPLTSELQFRVQHAHAGVVGKISKDIADALENHSTTQELPIDLINQHLANVYSDLHTVTPTIFIVNVGRFNVGYSWIGAGQHCRTVHYAASHARYAWLDVNAGPLEWGPLTVGEGAALAHGFPFIDDMAKFLNPKSAPAFLATVASYVVRTANTLMLPSVTRMPFPGEFNIHRDRQGASLKFITISDLNSQSDGQEALLATQRHQKEVCAAVAEAASESVMGNISCADPLILHVPSCAHCSAALENSRRYFSRPSMPARAYLDSKELHHWLRRFLPHIDFQALTAHSLPIVMIHAHEFILLDRAHQAVAFDDMVIVIVSADRAGVAVALDFFCNSDQNRHLNLDTANATREIVSATLDALFGVSPAHLHYEPEHGRVAADYAWAVAPTPASLFSSSVVGGFHVNDQIARNLIAHAAWSQWSYMEGMVLSQLPESLIQLDNVLKIDEYALLLQRWNLWLWKREQVENDLSLYHFESAQLFLRSMMFDMHKMAQILTKGNRRLSIERDCTVRGMDYGLYDYAALSTVLLSIALSASLMSRMAYGSFRAPKKRTFADRLPRTAGQEFLS